MTATRGIRGPLRGLVLVLAGLAAGGHATPPAAPAVDAPTSYAIDYVVTVRADDPGRARIRWSLAGIDEIEFLRLGFRDDRTTQVTGTGTLTRHGRTVTWRPGAPYAHLSYTVAIDRHRPPGGARFDSHAATDWIATRATRLFPRIDVEFRPGTVQARSAARLIFRLPPGWTSAAVGERVGRHAYRVRQAGRQFDRPRGWILLGPIARRTRIVGGVQVTVATAPGARLPAARLFRLYASTVPLLAPILGPVPPRLLVVSAPDPMWRGGLSGEESFFVHGDIPLRSADQTSTVLHELFHVWAPFTVADDALWISEGLAEYYALALPHRAGLLADDRFHRGLARLAKYGRWGIDLSATRDPAALNNSAPLVMWHLDRTIARATRGARGLDDAVRDLVRARDPVTTAAWLRAVNTAAGRDLRPLFRRHVHAGVMPALPSS